MNYSVDIMFINCKEYIQNYSFQIDIDQNETILRLKEKIAEKLGYKIKLVFFGKLLSDDDEKVSHYEFQKHEGLYVLKK